MKTLTEQSREYLHEALRDSARADLVRALEVQATAPGVAGALRAQASEKRVLADLIENADGIAVSEE